MFRLRIAAFAIAALFTLPSFADDIVSSWASVKLPPPPPLKAVKIEPARTALLLLDFDGKICNAEKRPRCFASIANVASLLTAARAHNVMVVYSTTASGTMADVPAPLAAKGGEPSVKAGVDKFLGTDLDAILKAKNIRTVIVTGTAAHRAAMYTASAAALRGYETIVPVDGMSADDPFAELAATWILANAPASVSSHVTLTRSDMVGY